MTPIAEQALRESIAHHKQNLLAEKPEDVRLGRDNCALCELHGFFCDGCPVKEAGFNECAGSPYDKVWRGAEYWRGSPKNKKLRENFREAEQKEIEFLKSLLEKPE